MHPSSAVARCPRQLGKGLGRIDASCGLVVPRSLRPSVSPCRVHCRELWTEQLALRKVDTSNEAWLKLPSPSG